MRFYQFLLLLIIVVMGMQSAVFAQTKKRHNCARYKDFRTQIVFNVNVVLNLGLCCFISVSATAMNKDGAAYAAK